MRGSWSFAACALAFGAAALIPGVASAQQRIELTPFVASYYHLTHVSEGDAGPIAGNPFTIDQKNAFAFGGRLTLPLSQRFAVEGEFAYALSGLIITENDIGGNNIDGGISQDGSIIYGSLRAVVSPKRSNLFLLAGPAIISRGGDAWDGVDDITDFGGVIGFGFRANVTPRFRVNFTAESYLYSFQTGQSDSKFQSDLLVSLGIPIRLGGQ